MHLQRSYQRWLDKRIYKMEVKFTAVLGRRVCREKKQLPTAISMHLLGVFFSTFCGGKNVQNFSKNILTSALKSYNI